MATEHKFPLIDSLSLAAQMDRAQDETVALILIPDSAGLADLLGAYRGLSDDIKKWQDSKGDAASKMVYFSFYADPEADEDLLRLDGPRKSVATALGNARQTHQTTFLLYGFSNDSLHQLDWSILNQDSWGILVDAQKKTRYVGEIKDGIPWGSGTMTHADQTVYSGSWSLGRKNGHGTLVKPPNNNVVEMGIFVDNVRSDDGYLLTTTVMSEGLVIDFSSVALRMRDDIPVHVAKIAKTFGWKAGDRYTLNFNWMSGGSGVWAESEHPMIVNGPIIESDLNDAHVGMWGVYANRPDPVWWKERLNGGDGVGDIRLIAATVTSS